MMTVLIPEWATKIIERRDTAAFVSAPAYKADYRALLFVDSAGGQKMVPFYPVDDDEDQRRQAMRWAFNCGAASIDDVCAVLSSPKPDPMEDAA